MQRFPGGASPDVWRTACREMAVRAQSGAVLHPAILAFVGFGSNLHRTAAVPFFAALSLTCLLSGARLVLIRSFVTIYERAPRLWHLVFFGGLLTTCAIYGLQLLYLIERQGLVPFTLFAFTFGMGLVILAIFVYSHALRIVWLSILLVAAPAMVGLWRADGEPTHLWMLSATVVGSAYLLWVARQQHRERWAGLSARLQLASRAAELEQAQVELQEARDELARLVAERTRELERSNEDYRRIFENAHDPILILRPEDERVLNVNRRACEIYGFSREELLGISLADISENVGRGRRQIAETLKRGVYHHFESVQFRKDGSPMFLEINASVIEYEGRHAILSINRDVTDRRRAEGLRLAKEAAERAARAKTQFLVNMSHEIRTPMAGVVGLSDLLLATRLDERQGGYARLIQSSAVSLLRVIDDILDFSKIEAGKLNFEEVPFDLHAMLSDVAGLLRIGAVARGTALHLTITEDVPDWVRGDPGRLRQVLMNLAGNAVKFTDGGRVEMRAEMDATGRVRLSVKDTGIGIPVEVQGRLFELFSQGDDSTSRRFGGTGLGLAISKRIVEAMGGEIGFESAPGAGSTFWIRVALERCAPPGTEPATVLPVRSRRILTAEDNPVNQLVIVEHLKSFGYEVKAVSNGLEALEALEALREAPEGEAFDLVLMDCQMPHLDGYEATRRIRQLPGKLGTIPIVALTAHAIREELDKCLEVGMNTYITKPFRGEALQRTIEQWIGGGGGAFGELAAPPQLPPADAAAVPEEPALDERQLESLRAAGRESASPDFLGRLVEQFRKQPYMEQFRAALEREDRAVLAGRAHALKGTSLFMGAARLPRLCNELEHLCREQAPIEQCRGQVDRIEDELRRVLRELDVVVGVAAPVLTD
jgi:PAS domain S-box-containing protein